MPTRRFIDPTPTSAHDVMSYCNGNWFSDYNYRLMQVYLTPSDRTPRPSRACARTAASLQQELLVVSGDVDAAGGVRLGPVKSAIGRARTPTGAVPAAHHHAPAWWSSSALRRREIDHRSPNTSASALPSRILAQSNASRSCGTVACWRSRRRARARWRRCCRAQAPATVKASEEGGALRLRWDAARHPYVTVTHVGNARTVVGIDLQGGSATLPTAALPAGGHFEFSLSDGMNTERVLLTR